MPKAKTGFYAVQAGRKPGIYSTWEECEEQVKGFPKAKFKRFGNLKDAEGFIGVPFIETSLTKSAKTYAEEEGDSSSPSTSSGSTSSGKTLAEHSSSRFKPYPSSLAAAKARKVSASTAAAAGGGRDAEWITVYTDGACAGNGAAGAKAGVGVWYGDNDPRNVSERCPGAQTNNRAELIAVIRCLETDLEPTRPLIIRTDSKYTIDCVTKWLPKWLERGWRTQGNKSVLNKSVIQHLVHLMDTRPGPVKFEYVKGHSGDRGNDGADRLAVHGATLLELPEREWETGEVKGVGGGSAVRTLPAMLAEELQGLDGPLFNDDELNEL